MKERNKRQQFLKREILPQLVSLFEDDSIKSSPTVLKLHSWFGASTKFSTTPTSCQILVAINIIVKMSFWIMKPKNKPILAKLSFKNNKMQSFEQLIRDAFDQFKREGYVEKLKTSITSESLPSSDQDLLAFLYDQASDG